MKNSAALLAEGWVWISQLSPAGCWRLLFLCWMRASVAVGMQRISAVISLVFKAGTGSEQGDEAGERCAEQIL